MYFQPQDYTFKNEQPIRTVYLYENSSNDKQPIEFKIRNQSTAFKDIAQLLKFKKLRLFNEQGAQYFEDDLKFVKNKTSLYASKGEEFDPHNCYGQYEMVRELGEGGFGKVFLANHKHSGQKCAIKIIKITSISDIDSIFVEAEILKSLKHDNIVKVTNCLTLKNMQVAIIMEYLEGGELLKYVQKQGRLDEETCKIFLRQIVKGIMYCHQNNLIHRDLKLENIVLVNSEEKKIKIIDFGIAGAMSRLTEEDLDAGSLGYMAPECFQTYVGNTAGEPNFKFDGRMDVWAIGVILYGMLCAELPFKGANSHEIKQNIKKAQYRLPPQIKKAISCECLNVVFRCLDPNPKTRIKIGQLIIHQWFAEPELVTQRKILNLNKIEQQIEEHAKQNESEAHVDEIIEKQVLKQKEFKPIVEIEQAKVKLKPNVSIKSFSKPKLSQARLPGSSIYKNKGNISKGKQNTNEKLKI